MMRGEGDASLMVQTMGVWNGLRLLLVAPDHKPVVSAKIWSTLSG
jgi:hypothetical protein